MCIEKGAFFGPMILVAWRRWHKALRHFGALLHSLSRKSVSAPFFCRVLPIAQFQPRYRDLRG
jgi:hypothetical protein